jgi:hypothetical protein
MRVLRTSHDCRSMRIAAYRSSRMVISNSLANSSIMVAVLTRANVALKITTPAYRTHPQSAAVAFSQVVEFDDLTTTVAIGRHFKHNPSLSFRPVPITFLDGLQWQPQLTRAWLDRTGQLGKPCTLQVLAPAAIMLGPPRRQEPATVPAMELHSFALMTTLGNGTPGCRSR